MALKPYDVCALRSMGAPWGMWGSTREHRTHTTGEGEAVRGLHKTPDVSLGLQPLSLGRALLQWKEDQLETGTTQRGVF